MYTETTRTGFGGKILGSIKATIIGILFFFGSFVVLFLNEGTQDLSDIAKNAVISTEIAQIENEGKLISLTGISTVPEKISDGEFLKDGDYILLERRAEIYSWVEEKKTEKKDNLGGSETKTTTYNYELEWNNTSQNSANFKQAEGHQNPKQRYSNKDVKSSSLSIGDFEISTQKLRMSQRPELSLSSEMLKTSSRPMTKKELFLEKRKANIEKREAKTTVESDSAAFPVSDRYIYIGSGSISNPSLGDERISFRAIKAGETTTVFGKQEGTKVTPFEYKKGKNLFTLFNLDHEQSISRLHGEYMMFLWLLRFIGFVMMWAGLNMIFGLLSTVLSILPIASKVSSKIIGFICGIVSLILTFLTIIIAKVFYNPILLIIAILVILAIVYFLLKKRGHKSEEKQAVEPQVVETQVVETNNVISSQDILADNITIEQTPVAESNTLGSAESLTVENNIKTDTTKNETPEKKDDDVFSFSVQ